MIQSYAIEATTYSALRLLQLYVVVGCSTNLLRAKSKLSPQLIEEESIIIIIIIMGIIISTIVG